MIKIITLSMCIALSGCAGAKIETTARYSTVVEATVKKNTAASELEKKKVETLGEIEKERIRGKEKEDSLIIEARERENNAERRKFWLLKFEDNEVSGC